MMTDRMADGALQPDDSQFVAEYTTVRSYYVHRRNCLLLRADFSPLFVGYYLHLMQHGLHNNEQEDTFFKQLLAFFTLYVVSRPWKEHHAWTLNVKHPTTANYFVAGSSLTEDVVGRVFTEDVREPETDMLYAQNMCAGRDVHTSVVPLPPGGVATKVETYYRLSEQRTARAFVGEGDEYALVTAQPGADYDWLAELQVEQLRDLESTADVKLLETRRFTFRCGCTPERILPVIRAMRKDFADELSEQGKLEVSCPRCGVVYTITPEMIGGSDTETDC